MKIKQKIRRFQNKHTYKNKNKIKIQSKKQHRKSRKESKKIKEFKLLYPLTQLGRDRFPTYRLPPNSKCKRIPMNDGEEDFVCPPPNILMILAKFPAKLLRKLFAIYPIDDFFNEMIIMALASDDEELQDFYRKLIESKLAPLGEKAGEVVSKFLNSLWGGVPILGTIIAVKNAADTVSEAGSMVTDVKNVVNTDIFDVQMKIYKNMIALEAFTAGIMDVLKISAPEVIKAFQNTNVFAGLYEAAKEGQFLTAVDNLESNMVLKELANNNTEKVEEVIHKIKELYTKLEQKFPSSIAEKITGSPEKPTSELPQVRISGGLDEDHV
jgi:hypothetical protein